MKLETIGGTTGELGQIVMDGEILKGEIRIVMVIGTFSLKTYSYLQTYKEYD